MGTIRPFKRPLKWCGDRTFSSVLADPPWRFQNKTGKVVEFDPGSIALSIHHRPGRHTTVRHLRLRAARYRPSDDAVLQKVREEAERTVGSALSISLIIFIIKRNDPRDKQSGAPDDCAINDPLGWASPKQIVICGLSFPTTVSGGTRSAGCFPDRALNRDYAPWRADPAGLPR